MFAKAYKLASCFTQPIIVSTRSFDKTVECGCGAFVVLNEEGWIVTVAHLWESFSAFEQHPREISDYSRQLKIVEQDPRLSPQQKHERIGLLKTNPRWITNHSFWWGRDGVQLKDIRLLSEGDLAIGRLEPFDPRSIPVYPVLKDHTTTSTSARVSASLDSRSTRSKPPSMRQSTRSNSHPTLCLFPSSPSRGSTPETW